MGGRSSANREAKGRRRVWLARLVLLACGLAVLPVLEIGLRVTGVAAPPPLFIPIKRGGGRTFLMSNQLFSTRFFFRRYEGKAAGVGASHLIGLLAPKPRGIVRVLFLGGSTVQGYPFPRYLASPAFLRAMLADAWPDRRVEVANLGTTAIASFPVLKILEEAIECEPDLVIVATGHNEFFGAYGVASFMRAGQSRGALKLDYALRHLRLARILSSALTALRGGTPPVTEKALMEFMAGREDIGPGDPLRARARAILEGNLGAMAALARSRGVPIVLCTLPSNEGGLAPVRAGAPRLAPEAARRWEAAVSAAEAIAGGDEASLRQRLARLREGEAICGAHARLQFLLGRTLRALGDPEGARAALRRAVDLDGMPWRAPSDLNETIRRVAREEGAVLADVQEAFRRASPDGIVGWELVVDHLHPSLRGQALFARAIVEALGAAPDPVRVDPRARARLASLQAYAARLGDTPPERYRVAQAMGILFSKEPLRRSNAEALRMWEARRDRLKASLSPAEEAAFEAWTNIAAIQRAGRTKRPLVMLTASAYEQDGEGAAARRAYWAAAHAAVAYTPMRLEAAEAWGRLTVEAGVPLSPRERRQVDAWLQEAAIVRWLGAGEAAVDRATGVLLAAKGRFREAAGPLLRAYRAAPFVERPARISFLYETLHRAGRAREAERLAAEVLQFAPDAAELRATLERARRRAARAAPSPSRPSPPEARASASPG